MKYQRFIVMLTLLVVSALAVTVAPTAASPNMVNVNIVFDGQVDTQLLSNMNAQVVHEFSSFSGVTVTIPENAVNRLNNNPNIVSWEYDAQAQILQDSIDWGVDRIDAERVWGGAENAVDVTGSVAGDGVKVAVIDTGIDYNHEDLAVNYAGGYDFYNNDPDPMDDHGHGTHVSGTIAALDNDITGSQVGVAPHAQIYALKVCSSSGSCPSSAIAAAIDWAASNGMDVASMSLGGSYSSAVDQAGQSAYAAGVLLVAASGNDNGQPVSYPAANEEFIAVGATDSNDNIASFSNVGSNQELVAPGVNIRSSLPNNQYAAWSGTSMATPHVSGVAAMVKSANPNLSNVEIRNILTSTAEDLGTAGRDNTYGFGLVDTEAAVAAAGSGSGDTTPPAQVTGLTASSVSATQIDLIWNANSESDLQYYKIYRDGVFVTSTSATSFSDTGLTPSTSYTYQVSAVDTSQNEGALSNSASATTQQGSGNTMYVQSITFEEVFEGSWFWGNYYTYATITVVDGNGNPLQGVTVSVSVTFPSGSTGSGSKTTDANGQVSFKWQSNACGQYTLNIDGLSLSGYTWDTGSGTTSETFTNC